MEVPVSTKCPYCSVVNHKFIEFDSVFGNRRALVTCCVDEGGCDRDYVVYARLVVNSDVAMVGEFVK